MAIGQMVMVMLMVITSLHMSDHQHALGAISMVVSSHTLGMYAFSIVSGRLADRWGRAPVILTGAGTLVLACALAPLSPEVLPLALALFLLGLGWNFCYVGGSSLLADNLSPAERGRTQGFNDLVIGLASAAGSLGSGVVFAALGYAAMGLVGVVASLIPLSLTAWWWRGQRGLARRE
jgi:MFS family permease